MKTKKRWLVEVVWSVCWSYSTFSWLLLDLAWLVMVSIYSLSTRELPIILLHSIWLMEIKVTFRLGGLFLWLCHCLLISLTIFPKRGMWLSSFTLYIGFKNRVLVCCTSLVLMFFDFVLSCRFIYLFIGIGVALFVISCCGCVGTCSRSVCCLSCVS